MTLKETLAALDAKATKGEWSALKGVEKNDDMRCGITTKRGAYDYLLATIENGASGDFCDTEFANAELIVALVNLYRSGDLVMVPSVESVEVALRRVTSWDGTPIISDAQLTDDEVRDMATAVLTSMGAKTDG